MFQIAIRPYNKLWDEEFLYSTWLKSYALSPTTRGIPRVIYNKGQRERINRLVADPLSVIDIACNPENNELIYGWCCRTGNILHYVYVKNAYRRAGIAKALLEPIDGGAVIWTHKSNYIWIEECLRTDPKYLQWIYDPYFYEKANNA